VGSIGVCVSHTDLDPSEMGRELVCPALATALPRQVGYAHFGLRALGMWWPRSSGLFVEMVDGSEVEQSVSGKSSQKTSVGLRWNGMRVRSGGTSDWSSIDEPARMRGARALARCLPVNETRCVVARPRQPFTQVRLWAGQGTGVSSMSVLSGSWPGPGLVSGQAVQEWAEQAIEVNARWPI
jgi:hypothetical protein